MRLRIVRRWLRAVFDYCDARIRRRDASAALLAMLGEEPEP